MLVILSCLRQLSVIRIGNWRIGRPLALSLLSLLPLCLAVVAVERNRILPERWNFKRAEIQRALEAAGGRHLIIIRYSPTHSFHSEWVYNAADIDAAPVIWAREMDFEHNRRLLEYFHDRQIWLLEPDQRSRALEPYRLASPPVQESSVPAG